MSKDQQNALTFLQRLQGKSAPGVRLGHEEPPVRDKYRQSQMSPGFYRVATTEGKQTGNLRPEHDNLHYKTRQKLNQRKESQVRDYRTQNQIEGDEWGRVNEDLPAEHTFPRVEKVPLGQPRRLNEASEVRGRLHRLQAWSREGRAREQGIRPSDVDFLHLRAARGHRWESTNAP